eukprot:gene13796-19417_t
MTPVGGSPAYALRHDIVAAVPVYAAFPHAMVLEGIGVAEKSSPPRAAAATAPTVTTSPPKLERKSPENVIPPSAAVSPASRHETPICEQAIGRDAASYFDALITTPTVSGGLQPTDRDTPQTVSGGPKPADLDTTHTKPDFAPRSAVPPARWFRTMKEWNRLMHSINGNSVASCPHGCCAQQPQQQQQTYLAAAAPQQQ